MFAVVTHGPRQKGAEVRGGFRSVAGAVSRATVLVPVSVRFISLLQLSLQLLVVTLTEWSGNSLECRLHKDNSGHDNVGTMTFDEIQIPVLDNTFTSICPLTLLVVSKAVMIAVPAVIAVTSPVLLTVTIAGLTAAQV